MIPAATTSTLTTPQPTLTMTPPPFPSDMHSVNSLAPCESQPLLPPQATNPDSTTTTTTSPPPPSPPPKKRKKAKPSPHILHQCTFRKTTWGYLHLHLTTPGTASSPPCAPVPHTANSACTTTTTATTTPAPTEEAAPGAPAAVSPGPEDLSPLQALPLLTAPLSAHFGITGAAIPIDVLQTRGRSVWIRVPRCDVRALQASLAAWVGSGGAEGVPGLQGAGGGRVKVAWRVIGVGGPGGGGAD